MNLSSHSSVSLVVKNHHLFIQSFVIHAHGTLFVCLTVCVCVIEAQITSFFISLKWLLDPFVCRFFNLPMPSIRFFARNRHVHVVSGECMHRKWCKKACRFHGVVCRKLPTIDDGRTTMTVTMTNGSTLCVCVRFATSLLFPIKLKEADVWCGVESRVAPETPRRRQQHEPNDSHILYMLYAHWLHTIGRN